MSTGIALKTQYIDVNSEAKLLAQVFYQDKDMRTHYVSHIHIPLVHIENKRDEFHIDELESLAPGNYLLQISLPNGDIITENFKVQDNEDTALMINLPQQNLNNLYTHTINIKEKTPSQLKTNLQHNQRQLGSENLQHKLDLFLKLSDNYDLFLLAENDSSFLQNQSIKHISQLINEQLGIINTHERIGIGKSIKLEGEIKGHALSFNIRHFEAVEQELFVNPSQRKEKLSESLQRQYLIQRTNFSIKLICLPTPWFNQQGQDYIQFLVDIHSEKDDPTFDYSDGFNSSITLNDPTIDSALSYVNSGALHKAAMLINYEHARDMLYGDRANPFAAMIGGYLLVLGLDKKSFKENRQNWIKWAMDLDDWYPWMSDGAILHASMNLMLSSQDSEQNYQALMRAYQRGLPVFSFGLKLMIDAMRYYANRGDDTARSCLIELENIAMHTDSAWPFLSVTLASKRDKFADQD